MKLSLIVEIIGMLVVVAGIWLLSPAVAIIISGIIIILIATIILKGGKGDKE